MNGESLNIKDLNIQKLKELFPEIVTENKIDWEKLRQSLGEDVEISGERYALNWAGKAEAFRVLQTPTTATLAPDRSESVNFESTENIFIEGENLEVLKILQKSYYGKIKMIYIDPPYNTGNDSFIYPDRFAESREDYLKRIGDKDEEGYLLKEGMFRRNSKDNGHYHSNWLSMMYPRLFLARNLLQDDGVIFVSIDDNEVHNLRLLMNEIFGEENFMSQLVWKKKYIGGKHAKHFVDLHEYILVYAQNSDYVDEVLMDRPVDELEKFSRTDEYVNVRGRHYIRPLKSNLAERKTLIYPIKLPNGKNAETQWMVSKETYNGLLKDGRILFKKKEDGSYQIYRKFYEKDNEGLVKVPSLIDDVSNSDGKLESKSLFNIQEGREIPFQNPKPSELIEYLVKPIAKNGDIVLDFFAGSCTTAHAVLNINESLNKEIKFICVQLPEKVEENSEAKKSGFNTISEIGKERIRLIIKKIKKDNNQKQSNIFHSQMQNLGFKVFKLKSSNFKIWRGDLGNGKDLASQLEAFVDPTKAGAAEEFMLFELLLKSGYDLNSKIEKCVFNKSEYYSVNNGELIVVLSKITDSMIKDIIGKKPQKVITLDKSFGGNDPLKTNTVLQMKDAGIDFRTI